MDDNLELDGSFINSIVGEGTKFRGELDLDGLLRIDGDFLGTIKTRGKVLVGKNGRAECTINAGTVVVGGIVKGNILSTEKVVILSTGVVIGSVVAPRFIVEEGVIFTGKCFIKKDIDNKIADYEKREQPLEQRPVSLDDDSARKVASGGEGEKKVPDKMDDSFSV